MEEIKIGAQIYSLRKKNNITQEQLANKLGVTNQAVSKWEAGICCPDLPLIPEIADYFGVSTDYIFGYDCESSIDIVCEDIKGLFRKCSEADVFSIAFRIAALLHEGVVSKGYKSYLPWKEGRLGTDDYEVYSDWSASICSEPQGETAYVENCILFTDRKYRRNVTPLDIRSVYSFVKEIDNIDVLRVMIELYELTCHDFDLYISVDEIAEKTGLSIENVEKALSEIPVQIKDTENGELYRIKGESMHIPPILLLLGKSRF